MLLSDGEDTSSSVGFAEALEYARRSGVAIYSIGLDIGSLDVGVRRKLEKLSAETGGRTFYIRQANELFQVYDEIDTGVGGDTANAVGMLLRKASRKGQALCVTHLAQVAVRADQQLRVSKQAEANSTAVDADVLAKEARVEEIARMLGGTVSDQSRAHAREMLDAANATLQ